MTSTGQRHGTSIPRVNEPSADLLATDRFETPELSAEEQVPPAYSDVPDQMSFSQPGLEADATIAGMLQEMTPNLPSNDGCVTNDV